MARLDYGNDQLGTMLKMMEEIDNLKKILKENFIEYTTPDYLTIKRIENNV